MGKSVTYLFIILIKSRVFPNSEAFPTGQSKKKNGRVEFSDGIFRATFYCFSFTQIFWVFRNFICLTKTF